MHGCFDGALEEAAGDVGVVGGGLRAEVERGGQVQRIGVDGEGFVQHSVAADLLELHVLQRQVVGQVVGVDRLGAGGRCGGEQDVVRPDEPDAAWLAVHRWVWDVARLDEIIAAAVGDGVVTLWLCGQAANAGDLVDRFDACILLKIDQATMRNRMTAGAGRGNDFGRVGASLEVAGYHEFVVTWRRLGAVPIDVMQDLDRVCEDLLVAAACAALNRLG